MLRRTTPVVKGHDALDPPCQVGDDEPDTWVKLTRVPLDLRHHTPRLFPALRLIAEAGKQRRTSCGRAAEAREVPGVVAMAATDKGIVYEGAFGTRDLGKGPEMTLDTIFRLASMTKAVTSVARCSS